METRTLAVPEPDRQLPALRERRRPARTTTDGDGAARTTTRSGAVLRGEIGGAVRTCRLLEQVQGRTLVARGLGRDHRVIGVEPTAAASPAWVQLPRERKDVLIAVRPVDEV